MRHLALHQVETNLHLGKTIEQLLPMSEIKGERIIRWASLKMLDDRSYEITLYQGIEDEAAEHDITDIYAVELDADGAVQPVYMAGEIFHFTNFGSSVEYVCVALGGSANAFMNEGFLQNEYVESNRR